MFDQYSDIFDKRGKTYHQAMCEQPEARKKEFLSIINFSKLQDGMVVCDIPSGGGYLKDFIECDVKMTELETSKTFYAYSLEDKNAHHVYCEDIAHTPFESSSIDRILSLSGLHHTKNRQAFYNEAFRILRPGGILCIADVAEMSDEATLALLRFSEVNYSSYRT